MKNIYVGNLPFESTQSQLEELFAPFVRLLDEGTPEGPGTLYPRMPQAPRRLLAAHQGFLHTIAFSRRTHRVMPTYQYRCKKCAHEFEEIQRFADEPLVQCPQCKENALVRLIGGAGLVFKGSGFYLTDYKNKSSADPSAAPAKPKPPAETGGASKPSDASPAPPPSKGGDSSSSSSTPKE